VYLYASTKLFKRFLRKEDHILVSGV